MRPFVETLRSITTITTREVVQLGMISNIHMRAANTKIAIMRCWTGVRPSIPKTDVGRAQRRIVTMSTMGRSTQYFTENLLLDISVYVIALNCGVKVTNYLLYLLKLKQYPT